MLLFTTFGFSVETWLWHEILVRQGRPGRNGGRFFLGSKQQSKQQITEIMVYNKTPERKNGPFLLGGFSTSLPFLWVEIFHPRHSGGCRKAAFARGFGRWIAMDFGSGRGADCCDARAPGLSHLFCRFRRAASGWAEFTTNSHSDDPISNVFGSIFEDMDLHWYFLHLFASISFFKFPLLNHMQKYRNTGPNCSRKIVVFSAWKIPVEGTAISESLPRCFRVQRYF